MNIETIAIVAKLDNGKTHHVYTKPETRQWLLQVILQAEGEIRISKEPAENLEIGKHES